MPHCRWQHQPPPTPEIIITNDLTSMDNPFLVTTDGGHATMLQQPRLSPIHEPPRSPTLSSMSLNNAPGHDDDFQDVFASPTPTQPSCPPPCTPCQHHFPAEGPTPNRPTGSPRAGWHSCSAAVARNGPAGNKTAHKAKDVWAFFEKMNGHSNCMICEWEFHHKYYL